MYDPLHSVTGDLTEFVQVQWIGNTIHICTPGWYHSIVQQYGNQRRNWSRLWVLMEQSTVTVLIHTKYQTDWSYKMLKLVQMHTQNFVIAVQAGNRNSCGMHIYLKLYEFLLKGQWTNQEVCSHQKVRLHQGKCVHITDVNTLPPPLISLLTMPPLITAYDNS